ncbi:hypothetical protein EJ571_04060 [Mycobacteroides franklinii]|uniref:Uncharacterized protein n=1 Tax=Mycobacteroides franklinii TaxID=948102 RepID=A0A4R5PET2_9MYCO|nr:hypothetical protein BST24_17770 [Mycobacteroides franklinii]TDH24310.1 hypothetical protein EJ571_04060 [Mycobacteroides franklinii]
MVAERRDWPQYLAKIRPGRPGFVPGLSVFQTLHLVSDNRNSYKMFGTTFMKFPGRETCHP